MLETYIWLLGYKAWGEYFEGSTFPSQAHVSKTILSRAIGSKKLQPTALKRIFGFKEPFITFLLSQK